MDELDVDNILDEHIRRNPTVRDALLDDPLFQAHVEWLKRALNLLVPALRREGLEPGAARRVVNTIVYGAPDPNAAIERILERDAQAAKALAEPVRRVIDEDTAKQLLEGEWVQ